MAPIDYDSLERKLCSTETPLAERYRVLFALRACPGHRPIDIIGKAFKTSGPLLGHELAFVLGQTKDTYALYILEGLLRDPSVDVIVRHEAAEAIGAISDPQSVAILKEYLQSEHVELRETCELALDKIKYNQEHPGSNEEDEFHTIDPAPSNTYEDLDLAKVREIYLDRSASLFDRYRAMFTLRNRAAKDPAAVVALCDGFEDGSSLFKHEVAFVLGQLSKPESVPALKQVLLNDAEHEMVRHEAAEALGGIAGGDCLAVLQQLAARSDVPAVVRDSCVVALDMYEYENGNEFQYAITS